MKRNGLVLAGGIIAAIRGALGSLLNISAFSTIADVEGAFPGYTAVVVFELVVSIALVVVGIFAIVKSNDRASGGLIRILGIAVIVAAVVDVIWAFAVIGSLALSSGLGSLVVLGLIGTLLAVGAHPSGDG